jgi:hypothetical protein
MTASGWPELQVYPGYVGLHTREQAPGAIANGTRVIKTKTEPGDGHPVGAQATVLGSIRSPPDLQHVAPYFYFVEWDADPKIVVGVISTKVAEL